jgi:hypothetical protein
MFAYQLSDLNDSRYKIKMQFVNKHMVNIGLNML